MITPFFDRHGAFCFTSNALNILMRAHYANNHQGYCVVFELKISDICKIMQIKNEEKYFHKLCCGKEMLIFRLDNRNIEFVFTKVVYSDIPPVIHLDKFLDIIDIPHHSIKYLIKHTVGVKYRKWQYEDEYRLIANINSKDSGFLNLSLLPFLKVFGIIMGSKLIDEDKNIFKKLCEKNHSRLYQAKCSDKEYKIEIELIQDYSTLNEKD